MNAQVKSDDRSLDQAKAQLSSIIEMVAALNCDYDRLHALRNEHEDAASSLDKLALANWNEENAEELAELEAAASDCESQEEASERIQGDPLSIEVRSGWHSPGDSDGLKPSEFNILLCTGGPAVRILGELDEHGQPINAEIQYQDWGTPWQFYTGHSEHDALLTYCQQFYFGK